MIDKGEFITIREDLKHFEEERENVIQLARTIIRTSKLIIYALHRQDEIKAASLMPEIKRLVKSLPKGNHDTGIEKVAVQEYVEAATLFIYIKEKRLATKEELQVDTSSYLLGLCDLTGELVRLAVNKVIRKDKEEALAIKEFVTLLYGEFLEFDLRNGELRKKSDSIKWNLRKLEDLALELA